MVTNTKPRAARWVTSFGLLGALTFGSAAELETITPLLTATNQTAASGDSVQPVVSASGRFVVFASSAGNVIQRTRPGQRLPSRMQVFRKDRQAGEVRLVSVDASGEGDGDSDSLPLGVSADGRHVLMQSWASNLVPNDTNGVSDIFIRDMEVGITRSVSVNLTGTCGNGASADAVMTADSRFVAFASGATDLVPADTNWIADVFVRDMQLGTTVLVSAGAVRADPGRGSRTPRISEDGRYVAFLSWAANVVPGVTNFPGVYVSDMVFGMTHYLNSAAHTSITGPEIYGLQLTPDAGYLVYEACPASRPEAGMMFRVKVPTGETDIVARNAVTLPARNPRFGSAGISPDGRKVVYVGRSTSAADSHLYLWDEDSKTNTLVSTNLQGAVPSPASTDFAVFHPSGEAVLFLSTASILTTNSVSEGPHLYLRNLTNGSTVLLESAIGATAEPGDFLSQPQISGDGSLVVFDCSDSFMPADTNRACDIFAVELPGGAAELISSTTQPSSTVRSLNVDPVFSASADGGTVVYACSLGSSGVESANANRRLLVADLKTGTDSLALPDLAGANLGGSFSDPSLSSDGRLLAFRSYATNVALQGANGFSQIYVRDLRAGTNLLASSTGDGTPGNNSSYSPMLSANGGAILFATSAGNLAPAGSYPKLVWRDLQSGEVALVSPQGYSGAAAMSPDGRYVAFGGAWGGVLVWDGESKAIVASNAAPVVAAIAVSSDGKRVAAIAGTNVYISDRMEGTSFVLSPVTAPLRPRKPSLAFDGNGTRLVYVAASTKAGADSAVSQDVYVYDFTTGQNSLVTAGLNGISDSPCISSDGRLVSFRNTAEVPYSPAQVYLYNREAGSLELISTTPGSGSEMADVAFSPTFAGDSRTLLFGSWSANLRSGDYNERPELFVLRLGSIDPALDLRVQIVYASPAASRPILQWKTKPGKTYHVQYKESLGDPAWKDTLGTLEEHEGQNAFQDDTAAGSKRFYRVVETD